MPGGCGAPVAVGRGLLIVGRPGVGKTTVVRRVLEGAPWAPDTAGGFYTEEVRVAGRRVGFAVIALEGDPGASRSSQPLGPRGVLADERLASGPRVGRYRVDLASFEAVGVAALERAVRRGRVVVVDEIGKMEAHSARFRQAVEAALGGQGVVLGTVLRGPHPWIDGIKARADVHLYPLTHENRDRAPAEIAAILADWLRRP